MNPRRLEYSEPEDVVAPQAHGSLSTKLRAKLSRIVRRSPLARPTTHQSSMQYHYEPVPDPNTVRLLVLSPGNSDILECSLELVKIDRMPSYEALSYVWGDATLRTEILCHRDILSIPTSLAVALRRLRHPTSVRILWADAICIDQQNIPERNQQVTLMGSIYRNATSVIAWLGDDRGNAKRAFDFIYELLELWPYDFDQRPAGLGPEHTIFQDPAPWKALEELVWNPYFERGWIQQEIGLAQHVVLYWGTAEIPWDVVCRLLFTFCTDHSALMEDRFGYNTGRLYRTCTLYSTEQRFQSIVNRRSIADESPWRVDFWDVLYDAWQFQFSDPHDVVYAFLGHPTAVYGEDKKPLVTIDYDKNIYQLYTELAVKGLVELHVPRVLSTSLVNHSGGALGARLPSWVADLSQRDGAIWSIGMFNQSLFTAGIGAEMSLSVSNCNTQLSVRGVVFDHVVGSRREFITFDHHDEDNYKACVVDTLQFVQDQDKCLWYEGMSPELVASLVLVGGVRGPRAAEDDIQQHLANFYAYCANMRISTIMSSEAEAAGISIDSPQKQGDRFLFKGNLNICCGRKVFRTQNGLFGLGPRLMQPGDLVCVLFGFHTPFILRKVDEHYLLIGECYVQGIMYGEVMDQWANFEVDDIVFTIH